MSHVAVRAASRSRDGHATQAAVPLQWDYLLLLANSTEQARLVDVLLYTRLEYQLGRRFDAASKIFTAMQSIPSSRFKALLAVKLTEYTEVSR